MDRPEAVRCLEYMKAMFDSKEKDAIIDLLETIIHGPTAFDRLAKSMEELVEVQRMTVQQQEQLLRLADPPPRVI